jgi:hypothetical protein
MRTITDLTIAGKIYFLACPGICILLTAYSILLHFQSSSSSYMYIGLGSMLSFVGIVCIMLSAVTSVSISETGSVIFRKPFRSYEFRPEEILEIKKKPAGFYANTFLITTTRGKFSLSPLIHRKAGALQVEIGKADKPQVD